MPNQDSGYYLEDGGDESSPNTSKDVESPKEDAQERDEETALVPKSMFGDKPLNPGDTVTLKVVHAYDDEYEVCPVGDKKPSPKPSKSSKDELYDLAEAN